MQMFNVYDIFPRQSSKTNCHFPHPIFHRTYNVKYNFISASQYTWHRTTENIFIHQMRQKPCFPIVFMLIMFNKRTLSKYNCISPSLWPEHQTLEHLVGHAEPGVPEDQPQVEAARLSWVVSVILQEGGLPVMQHVQQHWNLHQVNPPAERFNCY